MKEKTIVKSEKSRISKRIFIVCLSCLGLAIILNLILGDYKNFEGIEFKMFVDSLLVPQVYFYQYLICLLTYIGILFLVFVVVFILLTRQVSITVTDKRVFGTASWGKRVDLPLDMISAVSTSKLGGIAVSTSSGAIKFFGIKNNNEIHEAISKLLLERQGKEKPVATTTIKNEIPQSNADELKKYKDLLDSGVITQEEFDTKKKQLLGL